MSSIYTCQFCLQNLELKIKNRLKESQKININQGTLDKLRTHFYQKVKYFCEFSTRDQLKKHLMIKHSKEEIQLIEQIFSKEYNEEFLETKIRSKTGYIQVKQNTPLNDIHTLQSNYLNLNNDLKEINELMSQKVNTLGRIKANNFFSQTHPADFLKKTVHKFEIENTTHQMNFVPQKKIQEKSVEPLQLHNLNIPNNLKNKRRLSHSKKYNKENVQDKFSTPSTVNLKLNNVDKDLRGLISEGKHLKEFIDKKESDVEEEISANLSFQTNNGLISARDPFDVQEQNINDNVLNEDNDTLEEIDVNLQILNKEDSFSGKKSESGVQELNSNLFKEIDEEFETNKVKTTQNKFEKKITFKKKAESEKKNNEFRLNSLNEINSEFFVDKSQAEKKIFETLHSQLKKGLDTKILSKQNHINKLKSDINKHISQRKNTIAFFEENEENQNDSIFSLLNESDYLRGSLADIEEALKQTQNLNTKKTNILQEVFDKNNHLYSKDFKIKKII
jgi:hypothetical protein